MGDSGILKKGVQIQDGLLSLRVGQDRLEAILAPVGEERIPVASLEFESLKREAAEFGVIHGVLPSLEPREDGSFCIARGEPPVSGENAKITLHVKPSIAHMPRGQQANKDKVDFRELGNIVNVNPEQLLFEKIPLTEGTPGKDVLGSALLAKPGKDIKIRLGPGVRINEVEMKVYATTSGKFVMVDGKACVFGEHKILGDVDMTVGNVVFAGKSLQIQGEVLAGFKVKCRGDISIQRSINNAEVLAGGKLVVAGSVIGEQAQVRSKGEMVLGFVENGPVIETLGSLRIKKFMVQGQVRVNGDLLVIEENGTLVGGQCVVGGSVFVKELGSDGEVGTELRVGTNPGIELKREKLNIALKIWPDRFNEVIKNIGTLQALKKKEGRLPPEKEELLKRLSVAMPKLADKVSKLTEMEKEIQEEKEKMVNEAVYVYGRVYPGVLVKIGSAIRAITIEEEAVVIRFDPQSRQILIRKMTSEEQQHPGKRV
jgi:uncharacterized protein